MAEVQIINLGGNNQNMPNATTGVQIIIGGNDNGASSQDASAAFTTYFKDKEQCANYVARIVQCKSTTDFARFVVRDMYKDMVADGRSPEEAKKILTCPEFVNAATLLLVGYEGGKGLRNVQEAIKKHAFNS